MIKKILVTILAVSLLLALQSSMISAETITDVDYEEDITAEIDVWIPYGGHMYEAWKDIAKTFEEEHPANITVNLSYVPDIEQKLQTSVAGGRPPDVATVGNPRTLQEYAARGALMPLDEYVERDNILDIEWTEGSIVRQYYEGKMYGLPMTTEAVGIMYINSELFREAGLDPTDPPETWDELREITPKLTKFDDDDNLEQVAFLPTPESIYGRHRPYISLWSNGVELVDKENQKATFNSPEGIEAFQKIKDYIDDFYGVEKVTSFVESFGEGANDPFLSGQIAMFSTSCAYADRGIGYWKEDGALDEDFEYETALTPGMKKQVALVHGADWHIMQGTDNFDAAWEFLKWVTIEEHQQHTVLGWSHPVQAQIEAAMDYSVSARLVDEFIEYAKPQPNIPVKTTMWFELQDALEQVIYGTMDPETALNSAARRVERAWSRIR